MGKTKSKGRKLPVRHREFRRKVHLDSGEVWSYQVTAVTLRTRSPSGMVSSAKLRDIVGVVNAGFLDQWEGGTSIGIAPSFVKTYIETELVQGLPWVPEDHVKVVQATNGCVIMDVKAAEDRRREMYHAYHAPVIAVLRPVDAWLNLDEIQALVNRSDGSARAQRDYVADCVLSMFYMGHVEKDAEWGPGVRFRLTPTARAKA